MLLHKHDQARLPILHRGAGRGNRAGAPVKTLVHAESFHLVEKIAPSGCGIKDLRSKPQRGEFQLISDRGTAKIWQVRWPPIKSIVADWLVGCGRYAFILPRTEQVHLRHQAGRTVRMTLPEAALPASASEMLGVA